MIENEFKGSLFTKIKDNKITEKQFYYKPIKEIIEDKESESSTVSLGFWLIWIFIICGIDFAYVYFDNHYLEDKEEER